METKDSSRGLQGLLGSFLGEGWNVLAGLEAATEGLRYDRVEAAVDLLKMLSHRLKGSASLYGLDQLSTLAEAIERVAAEYLDDRPHLREGRRLFLRRALDAMQRVFESLSSFGHQGDDAVSPLIQLYPAYFPAVEDAPGAEPQAAAAAEPASDARDPGPPAGRDEDEGLDEPVVAALRLFRSQNPDVLDYFGPEADEHIDGIFASVAEVEGAGSASVVPSEEVIQRLFRQVHTLKGAAYTVGCVPMGSLSHQVEDVLVRVRAGELELPGEPLAAIARGADALRAMLAAARGEPAHGLADLYRSASAALAPLRERTEPLAEETAAGGTGPATEAAARPAEPAAARPTIRVELDRIGLLASLVGETVIARGRIDRGVGRLEELETVMSSVRERMLRAVRDFEAKHLNPRLAGGEPAPASPAEAGGPAGATLGEAFAELEWDRYDDFNILARRVGELASDVAEIQGQLARRVHDLRAETETLRRLTRDLRSGVGRARMVPVGRLFGRFVRLVSRLAEEEGKQIELALAGEGVEVDNAVVEAIADPLMHLIQNAAIHGLETPGERRAADKADGGRLTLSASTHGHWIEIEVADDGRGIDPDELRRQAVTLGLVTAERAESLDVEGALALLYLPGFSTRPGAGRAAGRGVGMDVVRSNVARLGGEVKVRTRLGAGTAFTLRLPLTLAVSEALRVTAGGQSFALPLAAVRQSVALSAAAIASEGGRETVEIGGERVPLLRLGRALGLADAGGAAGDPVAIVAESGGRTVCVAVGELVGIEEVVIQGLGGFLAGVDFLAGASITPEGKVVLLLDPAALVSGALPALDDPAGVRAAAERRPAAPPRLRLLLVDDSLSVRRHLGGRLEQAGFEVAVAVDGEEGLERLRSGRFDALITDLEMPRLNGYELIESVRRRFETRDLPIAVITTRAGDKHLALARRVGAAQSFTKPIDEAALIGWLRAETAEPSADTGTGAFAGSPAVEST